jgi:excisionase family DNA binding protein
VDAALLTPRAVAAALGFTTPRPVYRLVREGKLPASKVGGRLLIAAADVDALHALLAQSTVDPSQDRHMGRPSDSGRLT